jgi:hypothetical protein
VVGAAEVAVVAEAAAELVPTPRWARLAAAAVPSALLNGRPEAAAA